MSEQEKESLERDLRDAHLIIAALAHRAGGRLVVTEGELIGSPSTMQVYARPGGGMVVETQD